MNTALLIEMIGRDMKQKGIVRYQLVDEVAESPRQIHVGVNEAIYIYYFFTTDADVFPLSLNSGTAIVSYTEANTQVLDRLPSYQSSHITGHWTTVRMQPGNDVPFLLRYVRVLFSPQKPKEE